MSLFIHSGLGAMGEQSPRSFTRAEIAAGRRQGLIHGKESTGTLSGTLFWATGDWYPNRVRRDKADLEIIEKAIEREWGKS